MQTIRLTVLVLLVLLVSAPQSVFAQDWITVAVEPLKVDGFVAGEGVLDSLKDLEEALRFRQRVVAFVASPEAADIVITVKNRGERYKDGRYERYLDAEMRFGTYVKDLSVAGPGDPAWRSAAGRIVDGLVDWVKGNEALVREQLEKRSSSSARPSNPR